MPTVRNSGCSTYSASESRWNEALVYARRYTRPCQPSKVQLDVPSLKRGGSFAARLASSARSFGPAAGAAPSPKSGICGLGARRDGIEVLRSIGSRRYQHILDPRHLEAVAARGLGPVQRQIRRLQEGLARKALDLIAGRHAKAAGHRE